MTCNVCNQPLGDAIYRSPHPLCVTSLCEILPGRVEVWFCGHCGHLQSQAMAGLNAYYDQDYKILINSEEEDQLYALKDGRRIFRTEHQVETLLKFIPLAAGARVLDYGCAKSGSLRALYARRPDISPHAFDVSAMYVPFWEKFLPPENWATHAVKPAWAGSFDLVTSFFALEHVADPRAFVASVAALLKPGGQLYCVVPDTYENTADFVVADHVNHFSAASLRTLLENAGFAVAAVDDQAHASALVVLARKQSGTRIGSLADEVRALAPRVEAMASYWVEFAERVQRFELAQGPRAAAIYGSGFYGTFIASCLAHPERIHCFLDQNPHRQAQTLLGKPILPPEALPRDVSILYTGLNPKIARAVVEGLSVVRERNLDFFFP